MTPLNLPQTQLRLTRKDGVISVFCPVRKKKLVLTPEEWVRQHLIAYFVEVLEISIGRMGAEVSIEYNGRKKRADILVVDDFGKPFILVECKAPEIPISGSTFFQISAYQKELPAKILVLSNGLEHVVINLDSQNPKTSSELEVMKEWI
ncbi:MAG: type I restriction enzyme HsdR N-terminal domain-containing protein [Crocinitomicaceae bacterium]|nr:type I restriction enzyme HsdR N-terminal domain-containing protein [Crocinitomicaceae bacterium]